MDLRRPVRVSFAYTHPALSGAGEDEVRSWSEKRWRFFMESWEADRNHFLLRSASS